MGKKRYCWKGNSGRPATKERKQKPLTDLIPFKRNFEKEQKEKEEEKGRIAVHSILFLFIS